MEQLQSENEVEWTKREQLESEMMNLERINKQLKSELNDTLEKLQQQSKPESLSDIKSCTKSRLLQQLADKNIVCFFICLTIIIYLLSFFLFKELANFRHAISKQKKMYDDQSAELAHLTRRCEQYEGEVKRLRSRVEELKRELTTTEEDYDIALNTIKYVLINIIYIFC